MVIGHCSKYIQWINSLADASRLAEGEREPEIEINFAKHKFGNTRMYKC